MIRINRFEGEIYYRFEDVRVSSGVDEFDNSLGSYVELYLREFEVIKHTPKGVWLDTYGCKRFVLHSSRKRFADSSVEKASDSFKARKLRQKSIYQGRIHDADAALRALERYNYLKETQNETSLSTRNNDASALRNVQAADE